MTCLMFVENLLAEKFTEQGGRIVKIIISQLNSLLCLVNDFLDLQMIEDDQFIAEIQEFSPAKTLQFI